jgi:hypothetical protein
MRSELMLKARQRVPSWYNLTNLELGEDVISACQWLLQENRFLYAGINLQVCNRSQFSDGAIDSKMFRRGPMITLSRG